MERPRLPILPELTVNPIFKLEDFGLDNTAGLDEASRVLAEVSEAQIVRWTQFPAGALFFTLLSDDPESGGFYIFDRKQGVFYWLDFVDQKWGGYSLADYEHAERVYRISLLAQRPWLLKNWDQKRVSRFVKLDNGTPAGFCPVCTHRRPRSD